MSRQQEQVYNDIRVAFDLLKSNKKYKHGNVDLNKAVLCTNFNSDFSDFTSICGIKVVVGSFITTNDYCLCFHDPTDVETMFLRYFNSLL